MRMDTSTLLAQLFGSFMVLMGVAMLARPAVMDDIISGFERNRALMLMTGLFTFLCGFLAVSFHNVWEFSVWGLVTLFSWATLAKGVLLIVAPQWMMQTAGKFEQVAWLRKGAPWLMLLVGAYLCYAGWWM